MIQTALRQLPALAAATAPGTEANEPSMMVVVLTGLSLVFGILILLWLILLIEGKVFASIDKKKKESKEQEKAQTPAAPVAPVQAAPAAPVVQEGIPPEVVAAITAAVSQVEGGRYALRSVAVTPQGNGQQNRNQWGLAGVISYTEPF